MEPAEYGVGRQISEARLERNLSRDELGSMLGISSEQVRLFEEDEERMPASLLYKLSEIFKLPVTEFFK